MGRQLQLSQRRPQIQRRLREEPVTEQSSGCLWDRFLQLLGMCCERDGVANATRTPGGTRKASPFGLLPFEGTKYDVMQVLVALSPSVWRGSSTSKLTQICWICDFSILGVLSHLRAQTPEASLAHEK